MKCDNVSSNQISVFNNKLSTVFQFILSFFLTVVVVSYLYLIFMKAIARYKCWGLLTIDIALRRKPLCVKAPMSLNLQKLVVEDKCGTDFVTVCFLPATHPVDSVYLCATLKVLSVFGAGPYSSWSYNELWSWHSTNSGGFASKKMLGVSAIDVTLDSSIFVACF